MSFRIGAPSFHFVGSLWTHETKGSDEKNVQLCVFSCSKGVLDSIVVVALGGRLLLQENEWHSASFPASTESSGGTCAGPLSEASTYVKACVVETCTEGL